MHWAPQRKMDAMLEDDTSSQLLPNATENSEGISAMTWSHDKV